MPKGGEKRIVLNLSRSPSAVKEADEVAERVSNQMGFDPKSVDEIAISVTEAVNNAIEHGEGEILLSLIPSQDRLTIEVWDKGRGFNPKQLKDPLNPRNIMEARGRGVFIMRSLMDKVEIRFGPGTKVILVKYRRR